MTNDVIAACGHKKITARRLLSRVFVYILLVLLVLFVLMPFFIVLSTSFKSTGETYKGFTFFPREFTADAYRTLFTPIPFAISIPRSFLNTLIVLVPSVLGNVFFSSMAAFVFAKYDFAGRNLLFSVLLSSMMIPSAILMMPTYIIYSRLGFVGSDSRWVNFLPLILPFFFGTAAATFFLRQFMRGLPDDLVEAAEVEGLGKFGIFIRIILPLSKPALISQVVLLFIGCYNEYTGPLLYLQNSSDYTLQLAIQQYSAQMGEDIPATMAAAVVSMIPLLIIYAFAQKFFTEGIAVSGIKG